MKVKSMSWNSARSNKATIAIMKNIKHIAFSLALVAALCMGTTATAQTLRDANYHSIGRISPNGTVRDSQSQSIGFFDGDGTIRDGHNRVVGKMRGMQVYSVSNVRVGYINNDGTVRDGESRILGYIARDGKVMDASKRTIGYAQGVNYPWIACYFFFGFFK